MNFKWWQIVVTTVASKIPEIIRAIKGEKSSPESSAKEKD